MSRRERNFRLHLAAALLALGLGTWLGLSRGEWVAVLLCIGMVLAVEAGNTALERLADAVHPEHHPLIGEAKDTAAAMVLIAALTAVAVGCVIYGPRLYALLAGRMS